MGVFTGLFVSNLDLPSRSAEDKGKSEVEGQLPLLQLPSRREPVQNAKHSPKAYVLFLQKSIRDIFTVAGIPKYSLA